MSAMFTPRGTDPYRGDNDRTGEGAAPRGLRLGGSLRIATHLLPVAADFGHPHVSFVIQWTPLGAPM